MQIKKQHILFLFLTLISLSLWAQDTLVKTLDNKYREDQFYFGFSYNLLINVPSEVNLRGLSGGINFGYIRDMPINERRNVAIGLGLGLSFDQYGQNLFIGEDNDGNSIYKILKPENTVIDRNRFSTAVIEVPLEFRWRTSTAESYKFWRIYGGIRTGYTYWYKAKFVQGDNDVTQTNIPEFDTIRFTAHLSFGYNKINFFAAYAINPFFKDALTEDNFKTVGFQPLKLGFIFYIL